MRLQGAGSGGGCCERSDPPAWLCACAVWTSASSASWLATWQRAAPGNAPSGRLFDAQAFAPQLGHSAPEPTGPDAWTALLTRLRGNA